MSEFEYEQASARREYRQDRQERTERNEEKKKEYMPKVILVQSTVCIVMVLTVIAVGKISESVFSQLQTGFFDIMSENMAVSEIWSSAKSIFSFAQYDNSEAVAATSAEDESLIYDDEALAATEEETTQAEIDEDAKVTTVSSSGGEDIKVLDALAESTFAPVKLSCKAFVPVYGRITSGFGYRIHPVTGNESFHTGIDIAAKEGTNIAAAYYGIIEEIGYTENRGNYVLMRHGDGVQTMYCHCSRILADEGAVIRSGETIALVGSTGLSTGSHLHFELRINGIRCNPIWVLDELA